MLVSNLLSRISRPRIASAADVGSDVGVSTSLRDHVARRTTAARKYGGRLPLPQSVRDLTESVETRLVPVHALVDRLAETPLVAWLDVGRLLIADRDGAALRSAAWRSLDLAIAEQRLGVTAWYVRDAVETAAYVASHSVLRLSPSQRRLFAAAHSAADDATLALLARPHLVREDFETLVAPFAVSANT